MSAPRSFADRLDSTSFMLWELDLRTMRVADRIADRWQRAQARMAITKNQAR